MINEPIPIFMKILDLELNYTSYTDDVIVTSLSVHSNASLLLISDHFAITFSLNATL